jgi:hypothetical protein
MPQLDQFPIIFQFKSFMFSFGFLYLVFLLLIVPTLHGTVKSRKIYLNFITSIISLSNYHVNSVKFLVFSQLKKLSANENIFFKLFESTFTSATLIKFYRSLN